MRTTNRRDFLRNSIAGGALVSCGLAVPTLVVSAVAPANAQFAADKKEKKPSTAIVEGKTLEEWAKDLKDKDPYIRENAIHMLKVYGSGAQDYAPVIIFALGDRDVSIRVNAAITLGFIGMGEEHRKAGIDGLKRLLADSQGIVRYQAAQALNRLGRDATPAAAALLTTLRDNSSWEIRRVAASALGTAGFDVANGPDRTVLRALIEALGDPCGEVRVEVLKAMINLGVPGVAADKTNQEQALVRIIDHDKQPRVSIWARVAWMRVNPIPTRLVESGTRASQEGPERQYEKHLTAICKHLKSRDYLTRMTAAQALAIVGRDAKSRVPDLIDILENEKESAVLGYAAIALGEIGRPASPALPALQKMLHPSQPDAVKKAAQEAVDKIQGNK